MKKPRDVIDQRGASPAGGRLGGGMGRLPVPGGLALPGGLGIVGVIIYIAIQVFFSGDGGGFSVPTGFGPGIQAPGQPTPQGIPPAQDPQRQIKGGVIEREAPLHASNVQLLCPECGKPTRLGKKILGDGRKVRICRKCEGVVDK